MPRGVVRAVVMLPGLIARAVLAGCALAAPAWADPADAPLLWRNSGALTAPAGLPRARGAELPRPGSTSFALGAEIASQFTQDRSAGQDALIDVETTTLLLAFEHGFSSRWAAGVEVPWVAHDGGFLDSLINGYHDGLGFPDGGRERVPDDRVFVRWRDGRRDRVAFTDAKQGVGDLKIHVARAFVRPDASPTARTTALRLELELPTGDAQALTGNEGVEVSLAGIVTDRELLATLGLTLHASAGVLAQLDRDALYEGQGHRLTAFGNFTVAWPLAGGWTLKGQLDAHSATADTPLRQVGGWSLQGSLGAARRVSESLVIEGGFAEDLRPGSAPDIAFLFALRGTL